MVPEYGWPMMQYGGEMARLDALETASYPSNAAPPTAHFKMSEPVGDDAMAWRPGKAERRSGTICNIPASISERYLEILGFMGSVASLSGFIFLRSRRRSWAGRARRSGPALP